MRRPAIQCRVCGCSADFFFTKQILRRHDVSYFKCPGCGQVQTEQVFWLAEAYEKLSFQRDVGMADRSIWTALTTVALAHRLGIGPMEPCLDWGAGTGLFVRLCRDHGMNFYYRDPYAQNIFARGFEAPDAEASGKWAGVTAFEVVEHFPDPSKGFAELFAHSPRFIFFSTLLYESQAPDWWYFTDDGQHVAFYTRKSLEILGQRAGYHMASNSSDLHAFSRDRIADRILDSCRKSRERIARRYRRKHGSRILGDFDHINLLLRQNQNPEHRPLCAASDDRAKT
jgi:hypothetical protein